MREEFYDRDSDGWPIVSSNRALQQDYVDSRKQGNSHNVAEILAKRRPPASLTDREFNMGRHNNNQFADCPALGNYYRDIANKAGVATAGKYYVTGLGRFPGDPRAWVRSRGEVLAIAKERNLVLDGLVSYRGDHVPDPTPDIPLAEDLWEQATNEILAKSPGMRLEDAREEAFNLRTGKYRFDNLEPALEGLASEVSMADLNYEDD
jgi:hypothetical protein